MKRDRNSERERERERERKREREKEREREREREADDRERERERERERDRQTERQRELQREIGIQSRPGSLLSWRRRLIYRVPCVLTYYKNIKLTIKSFGNAVKSPRQREGVADDENVFFQFFA